MSNDVGADLDAPGQAWQHGDGRHFRSLTRELPELRAQRQRLATRWWRVWLELAAHWLALALAVLGTALAQRLLVAWWAVAVVPVAAVFIGLVVHRIGQFTHEGAHFNMAPTRRFNEIITNLGSAALILSDVRTYRPIHLAHHRHLGSPRDTEITYTQSIDIRFLVRNATGLAVIDTIRARRTQLDAASRSGFPLVPLAGVVGHVVLMAFALVTGHWWLALAWALGAFSLHPMFNSIRQAFEHRSPDASRDHDYRSIDHGEYTRMFTASRLGWVLGGVGFDRHLLHHWEPGISYTRLPDFERLLVASHELAEVIDDRVGTYARTGKLLWRR